MTLVKVCPKCGYANDPADLFCLGFDQGGDDCGYSIALTPITMAGGSAPADAREDVDAELPHQPDAKTVTHYKRAISSALNAVRHQRRMNVVSR